MSDEVKIMDRTVDRFGNFVVMFKVGDRIFTRYYFIKNGYANIEMDEYDHISDAIIKEVEAELTVDKNSEFIYFFRKELEKLCDPRIDEWESVCTGLAAEFEEEAKQLFKQRVIDYLIGRIK